MRKSFLGLVALLALGLAQPVWSGTVYTYGVSKTIGGTEFATQIRLTNDSGAVQSAFYLFIPAGSNGADLDREVEAVEIVVPPRTTINRDDLVPDNGRGLLEFRADDGIAVTARIVGVNSDGEKTFGVEVPAIDSVNAVAPGRTAVLQGISRTDGVIVTNFFIANLSIERAVCGVEARKRGGTLIVNQTINVPPLTVSPFIDVLDILGIENAGDVSFAVTCDKLARPFAITHQLGSGEALHIPPSATGKSTLDPFPSNDCPDDAVFRLDGVFHIPTQGNGERVAFTVPTTPGERFDRIILTMEFTHGGWNRVSSGNHAVFWLNRTAKWASNLFGYLNLFGPNKNFAKLQTNVDLPRGVINAVQQGGIFDEGETYVVFYTYDTAANFIEAVISRKGGGEVIRMSDKPTVRNIVTSDNWTLVFGHTSHEEGPEVTTLRWQYKDLCLRVE